MSKPRNVILIVADSLRFDSAYKDGSPGVPYLEQNAIQFLNARSSGCWTLPGTSSMFTGLLPHEHGATSQTRWLGDETPSLPRLMKQAGYKSIQITSNPVTTEIFNVNSGFDEMHKGWQMVESKHSLLLKTMLALNRPRIRRMLLKPKDLVFEKASEDLRQGVAWAQKISHEAFGAAKKMIAENNANGQGVFMFINLMETHYPYHIADTFALLNKSILGKLHEWKILFHFLSQSFLKTDKQPLTQADLDLLRTKQQLAWKLIQKDVNDFCREMHEEQDNLVIFCSDHGDNFGDQGWQYHFSNVTDGGNRVPLFWMDHEHKPASTKSHNVSSRFIQQDILRAVGLTPESPETLMEETPHNLPFLQSFWYDNEGKTLDKYKYNQLAFIEGHMRYVWRAGKWMAAPVGDPGHEPRFEYVENNFNPLEEAKLDTERKQYLEKRIKEFNVFSDKVMNKGK